MNQQVVVVVLGIALVAGCSSGAEGPAPLDSTELDGHVYSSTAIDGANLPEGLEEVELRFADSGLAADAGCNEIGFDYELDDGELRGTATFTTSIACGVELDQWIEQLVEGGVAIEAHGDELTLTNDDVTVRLERGGSVSRP